MVGLFRILSYLSALEPYKDSLEHFLQENTPFLCQLATLLEGEGRDGDAMEICQAILEQDPLHNGALRLTARLLSKQGDVCNAMERLLTVLQNNQEFTIEEVNTVLAPAIPIQQEYLTAGRMKEAKRIVQLVATINRSADFSATLSALEHLEFQQEQARVLECRDKKEFDQELEYRISVFRNPRDEQNISAIRLSNIYEALSCILFDQVQEEHLQIAKEMLAAVPNMPVTFQVEENGENNQFACFDRYYRKLFEIIDIDRIFGPPYPLSPWPEMDFFSSRGQPLTPVEVQAKAREDQIEVVFFAQASAPYARKFAGIYARSFLKNCDCNFRVIVCIMCGREEFLEIVQEIGIKDDRVVFFNDQTVSSEDVYSVVFPNRVEMAEPFPTYYACVGLLRLGYLLNTFAVPVILSGIDTVLQRGFKDMLEHFQGCDLVLNKISTTRSMASQMINSLVLAYPTYPSMLFASFLKNYLGPITLERIQPFGDDQLVLFLAKHHVMRNCPRANITIFEEHDINNAMFTKHNVPHHREYFNKFRFVNIFSGGVNFSIGNPEGELDAEDLVSWEESS